MRNQGKLFLNSAELSRQLLPSAQNRLPAGIQIPLIS
jgi:hypothetical protein